MGRLAPVLAALVVLWCSASPSLALVHRVPQTPGVIRGTAKGTPTDRAPAGDKTTYREEDSGPEFVDAQNVAGTAAQAGNAGQAGNAKPIKMDYHAGPVMWQPINVYIVWLGTNFTEAQKGLVRTFIASLNPPRAAATGLAGANKAPVKRAVASASKLAAGQPAPAPSVTGWWNINRLYHDTQKRPVSDTVTLRNEVTLRTAPELTWNATMKAFVLVGETSVVNILTRVLDSKALPVDPNGAYTIFTDNNIFQMGVTGNMGAKMCERYCGWHDSTPYNTVDIKYLWVGMAATLCPKSCIPFAISGGQYASPAGDMGIQGAISIFAHELAETASDPVGDGWWSDETQEENGDKCQWKYGNTQTFMAPSGRQAVYNLVGANGTKFLIQGNWDFKVGACANAHPGPV